MEADLAEVRRPRHRKASDWVAQFLRDSIIGGRLEPGAPLPLAALAEEVGLSATPVREALRQLQQEGLVIGDAHRTFRVARLHLSDISDYYELHGFLEGVIAERAAAVLTANDIQDLRNLDAEMARRAASGDFEGIQELNFAFHRKINSSVASGVMHRYLVVTSRVVARRSYPDVDGWVASIQDHGAILDALESGDGSLARQLMAEHINHAGQSVVDDLRERGWV